MSHVYANIKHENNMNHEFSTSFQLRILFGVFLIKNEDIMHSIGNGGTVKAINFKGLAKATSRKQVSFHCFSSFATFFFFFLHLLSYILREKEWGKEITKIFFNYFRKASRLDGRMQQDNCYTWRNLWNNCM